MPFQRENASASACHILNVVPHVFRQAGFQKPSNVPTEMLVGSQASHMLLPERSNRVEDLGHGISQLTWLGEVKGMWDNSFKVPVLGHARLA